MTVHRCPVCGRTVPARRPYGSLVDRLAHHRPYWGSSRWCPGSHTLAEGPSVPQTPAADAQDGEESC